MTNAIKERNSFRFAVFWILLIAFHALLFFLISLGAVHGENETPIKRLTAREHAFSYIHDEVSEVPWSIHIAKIGRGLTNYFFGTTLGGGDRLGMSTVSDQVKSSPHAGCEPVIAVNGDFYNTSDSNPGDPRSLQVWRGEVVSAPTGHMVFWVDKKGDPFMAKVDSAFHVTLPTGQIAPIGLNEERTADSLVLYTAVSGESTRTRGGVEIPITWDQSVCAPLRLGVEIFGTVQGLCTNGNSRIPAAGAILSIGEDVVKKFPAFTKGMKIRVSPETIPKLSMIDIAIGGGPALVERGQARMWGGIEVRHPRVAIGWNSNYIFLVEVDGRQHGLSVGMTFTELAAYMRKLGCDEAMNLDGGGSATMWVCGNVMNNPSEGHERPGANALVLFRSHKE